jgi:amino acid transporter
MREAVALTVGVVVGAGIFRTPALVAANAGSEAAVLLAWALGGAVSLVGALCYAELASAYPHAGGDYHYLMRAFGHRLSYLFAWSRVSVIQTGSIALLAFVFGDYASQLFSLGRHSSAVYAALVVIVLTGLNVVGVKQGTRAQNLLTSVVVAGVGLVIIAGLGTPSPVADPTVYAEVPVRAEASSFGLMMIFVLLTYGGWNEAVYLSAELRGGRRQTARALVFSILFIAVLYVLVNWAYLSALGHAGLARSEAVASEVMQRTFNGGGRIIAALVAISALTAANATLFTGARSCFALGRDFPALAFLGRWSQRTGTPGNALLIQGGVALALIFFGAWTRKGFVTIIEYTAPVFWFFFFLAGLSLFVLRRKEPDAPRPFRVPLYPLTPLVFCATSAYLLYSSLVYTGAGALAGVAVLGAGSLPLVLLHPGRAEG